MASTKAASTNTRMKTCWGRRAMCDAMFDWLEDDNAVHPLNLERALVDFNVILALYASSLNHEVVAIPYEPEADLVPKLRSALAKLAANLMPETSVHAARPLAQRAREGEQNWAEPTNLLPEFPT